MTNATPPVRLQDLTALEFAGLLPSRPVILLPLGSQENHGPHQPMGDFALADILAERIAHRAWGAGTPCFVAPAFPFGVADYFGSSPGGTALTPETFRRVLSEWLEGLLRHGLRRIVILNAHGGNVPVIHDVTLALRRREGVVVPSFYLWKVARQLMERWNVEGARFGHGAEPLLSLNMALRPGCVRESEIPAEGDELLGLKVKDFGVLDFEGLSVEAPLEFNEVPKPAIEAAWAEGSKDLGAAVAEELVAAAARFVAHAAAHTD
ncbi:MAG: creatininase family protein [Rhodospirillales bacterium]|nr:creatininase family protein [Rhodospirillales bacterium]MDE2319811.1 creatininase family protein [Rhodospirillales bacterium]